MDFEWQQVLVIARVQPRARWTSGPVYRCILAMENNTCPWAPTCMLRFVDLVRHPDNAPIVRAELRRFSRQYIPDNKKKAVPPPVHCAYASVLLGLAWQVELEKVGVKRQCGGMLAEGQSRDDFWLPLDELMLSGAMSVVDITDPEQPRYCFIPPRPDLPEEENEQLDFEPLSALGFFDAWSQGQYGLTTRELDRHKECVVLDKTGLGIIPADRLKEAFLPFQCTTTDQDQATDELSAQHQFPSLFDLMFKPSIICAAKLGNAAKIDHILSLPGMAARAKAHLVQQSPFPARGVPLLASVLERLGESSSMDLFGSAIEPTQLLELLSLHSKKHVLKRLDLSENCHVTVETLAKILDKSPRMERLILMDCPAVDSAALSELLRSRPKLFYNMKALIHPLFLNTQLPRKPPSYPVAFTFLGLECRGIRGCSLPFMRLDIIVQALTDHFHAFAQYTELLHHKYDNRGIFAAAAFTGERAEGTPWGNRAVTFVPGFSADALLSNEDGWCFVLVFNPIERRKLRWAFVRLRGTHKAPLTDSDSRPTKRRKITCTPSPPKCDDSRAEIHDLDSFLQTAIGEGRLAPSPQAVEELRVFLTTEYEDNGHFQYELMDSEGLTTILSMIETYKDSERGPYV